MRKNGAITIKSEWSEFLAELDVKIMICGFAQEIVNWQPLDSFFREMPFYRLYLPTKGEFCISSVYSIESTTLIRPGTVYLIPDCLVLKYQGIAPSDHYWIHFFSRQMQKLPFYEPLELPEEIFTHPRERFASIVEHCRQYENLEHQMAAKCEVEKLLIPFIEHLSSMTPVRNLPKVQLFSLIEYIDSNIGHKITVSELAARAHLSRSKLTALFVGQFRMLPKQFITMRRLYYAKHLLLQRNLPIKEIAWRCGYPDEYFFFRIFKKYVKLHLANSGNSRFIELFRTICL